LGEMLHIKDVSKRSGVAASALRFYEDRGLIASTRGSSGHRYFDRAMLRRVAVIAFAQQLGMTLAEIKQELDRLPNGRVPTGDDWAALALEWSGKIDARIAALQRLKAGLTRCIGCGCLSLEHCELSNPRDRAGLQGSGARYLIRPV
jgi:MerR family transcriptional regulator, redox-sensitive transcriptional activator SoxR